MTPNARHQRAAALLSAAFYSNDNARRDRAWSILRDTMPHRIPPTLETYARRMLHPEGVAQRIGFVRVFGPNHEERNIVVPRGPLVCAWSYTRWLAWRLALAKKLAALHPDNGDGSDVAYRLNNWLEGCGETSRVNRVRSNRRETIRPWRPFRERLKALPLTPDAFRYDRAVGLELECFGPSVESKLPLWAREGSDGSLQWGGAAQRSAMPPGSDPREYRCLVKRSELEVRVHKLCALLASHRVNKSCGLHVHFDMRGRTEAQVASIARRLDAWLEALAELQPESRRDNSYCKPGVSTSDRYRRVNLTAFRKYSTLEVRFGGATLSAEKIIAWVRLLDVLIAWDKKPAAALRSGACVAALVSVPLPEYERGFWLARHRALNPAQYTAAGTAAAEPSDLPDAPRESVRISTNGERAPAPLPLP